MPIILLCLALLLTACAEFTPDNVNNACEIFQDKSSWIEPTQQAAKRWGISEAALLAIIYQESHFEADAKPPRVWLWGFIPWGRVSSAYGYAQALDGTWDEYRHSDGSFFADRDEFADAVDFVGWYCHKIHKELGISLQDVKNLYLAYYEGIEGYKQRNYAKKAWLQKRANEAAQRTKLFQNQLTHCQTD